MRRNTNWQEDAFCAQVDYEIFFPEKGECSGEAKRICFRCIVRPECLIAALLDHDQFGVRGGLSERDRRSLGVQVIAVADDPVAVMEIAETAIEAADARFAVRFQRKSTWIESDFREAA